MKKTRSVLLTLVALIAGVNAMQAAYTVDFNTPITTSNHNFKVAKGWGHIVPESNYDGYGPYYMTYSYYADSGVDGTGTLSAARQFAGDYSGGETIYDLLVTPAVQGTVTLDVKASVSASSSNNAFVEVYAINGDGSRGSLLKTIKQDIAGYNTGNNAAWATFTLAELTEGQKLGLRLQYVYVDNFTAGSADIPAEHALEVTSVASLEGNTGNGGTTTYFTQQPDGMLKVQLQVTLTNNGDYDYAPGDKGFSLTPARAAYSSSAKTYYEEATVNISEALAAGESKTIDVDFNVPYTAGWANWYVRENITGTTSSSYRYAGVKAYESKFVLREAGSTASNSIAAQNWGTITESTTKHYEIANTGTAPLKLKSLGMTGEGFTIGNAPTIPEEGLEVAAGQAVPLDITNNASAKGIFNSTLNVTYVPAIGDKTTFTLDFTANVIGANTWTADFNNNSSTIAYPAGVIAEGGITSDYQYISPANYNNWIKGRTTASYATANNKFITPKLHAAAGDRLAYDVKGVSGTSYFAKVYVSSDRKNWGEPVAYYTYGETTGAEAIGSGTWVTKDITFAEEGDYYVAFALYGEFAIDNIVGLEKVDVPHDLFIKSVSWPDASIKSGSAQTRPIVDIIPLTNEAAGNYTVKYVYGENSVELASKNLTASASSTTSFNASWTPQVETTTTFPATKVVFEFTDGTRFETETFDLTVTNEARFHFLNSLPSSKWYEPTDRSEAISFGKTNKADTQTFIIYNWGSAPLTVNSIALPEGFTTSVEFPLTVAAMDENNLNVSAQALDITFSAETAGTYGGDMVITYSGDQTFALPVSGTMLDASKFYANFDDGGWPKGSVYQSNVSSVNGGSYSAANYYISASGSENNLFVTPKLTAQAGEKLLFDAKLYSANWSEGKVVVYAAATRDELVNFDPENDTRKALFSVSGLDEKQPMTTDYQTFEVTFTEAGDYYVAFEISGRPSVDEIYGLTMAEVAHDWTLVSSSIPTEGMQNIAMTATVNVANFGIVDEAAEDITVTAYLDGEAVATAKGADIPMSHQLSAAGTQQSVTFRSPKAGTFPVYVEVKAGDYSVKTEAVDVVFAEEVALAEGIQVGTQSATGRDNGFVDWYNNDGTTTRYTDILYTAAKIQAAGIKAGDKIASISFKASNSAKKFKAVVTSWVGVSTGNITYGSPDKTAMAEVSVYNGEVDFPANAESVILLPQPIVWDGTSDIRVYTEAVGQGSGNWQTMNYAYDNDISMSFNGTKKAGPVAYFTLAVEPAAFAGRLTNSSDEGIAHVELTLVSTDGDGVQYSGMTADDGSYHINVIQTNREYEAVVDAEGYLKKAVTVDFNGNVPDGITLYKSFGIVGDTGMGLDWDADQVMTQSDENPNVFTLVMDNVEIAEGTYEYKLRADGAWNLAHPYELPYSGKNEYAFDSDVYTLHFTANIAEHTLVLTAERHNDPTVGISEVHTARQKAEANYNLTGQKVTNTRKGLYIINGKKMLIK